MCAHACMLRVASLQMALSEMNKKQELMAGTGALRCGVGMPTGSEFLV